MTCPPWPTPATTARARASRRRSSSPPTGITSPRTTRPTTRCCARPAASANVPSPCSLAAGKPSNASPSAPAESANLPKPHSCSHESRTSTYALLVEITSLDHIRRMQTLSAQDRAPLTGRSILKLRAIASLYSALSDRLDGRGEGPFVAADPTQRHLAAAGRRSARMQCSSVSEPIPLPGSAVCGDDDVGQLARFRTCNQGELLREFLGEFIRIRTLIHHSADRLGGAYLPVARTADGNPRLTQSSEEFPPSVRGASSGGPRRSPTLKGAERDDVTG